MTGDEAFIPTDLLKSQDSQEAWLALTSHRHLLAMGTQVGKLRRAHTNLHLLEALMDEEVYDTLHEEIMEEMDEVLAWVERGKTAIWS